MNLIKMKDVMRMTGLSKTSIYLKTKASNENTYYEADFPRPISLGKRNVAWIEHEVQDWIQSKIDKRETDMTEIQQ